MRQLPINSFLTWRNNFVIVVSDVKNIGIRFFDDTEEDEVCLVTPRCQTCNEEIKGVNVKYCCRSCASIGAMKSRWGNRR